MTRPAERVVRFGATSRWVHAGTGLLTVGCILSAAVLYNGSLSNLVGNRHTVRAIHLWCGFALPLPLLLGLASATYRRDLHLLNRFGPHDWQWLRSRTRRDGAIPVGKFNAGQKLNAALSAGSLAVLLLTGAVMYFTQWTPLAWRSGATFTHDWFALAFGVLVCGHTLYAVHSPVAMRAMRTGSVPLSWARREHGAWAEAVDDEPHRWSEQG